jgi:putative tRNA adenosine deaminase-associated protein
MDEAGVDFAFIAWRDEGRWSLSKVPADVADSLPDVVARARRHQGEAGSLAFVSVADEFFVCLRVQGARTRLLLSDVTALLDWPLAEEAGQILGLDADEVEDIDDVEPAGDLTLLQDLGVPPAEIDALCSDPELYPDEQIAALAARIGFGEELDSQLHVART